MWSKREQTKFGDAVLIPLGRAIVTRLSGRF
jgi:hypothetical protein